MTTLNTYTKYLRSFFLFAALIASPAAKADPELINLDCLAKVVYYEARGEGEMGMLAVAWVVLNRVMHPNYPKTICEVVYQKKQFSWTAKEPKPVYNEMMYKSVEIAMTALDLHARDAPPPAIRPLKKALFFDSLGRMAGDPSVRLGNHNFSERAPRRKVAG